MIGYKVVMEIGEEHRSAIITHPHGRVCYLLGEWVKKHYGPLAVFEDLGNARVFATSIRWRDSLQPPIVIYLCEYRPSKCLYLRYEFQGTGRALSDSPTGTRFADAVKLIEGVK